MRSTSRAEPCRAFRGFRIFVRSPHSRADFRIVRQGKHIVMSDGSRVLTIPRHNPVSAFTMGGLVKDAGLTPDQFRKLL